MYGAGLIGITLLYIISRIWMYGQFGDAAFGYDTGIYRHHIIGFFDRIGDQTAPPFGFSSLTNMLMVMGMSVHSIMYTLYMTLSIGVGLAFFAVVRRWIDIRVALISLLIFSLSIVQFEFYWWYYYRNLLALFCIFGIFLLVYYRSYLIVFPLCIIGVVHPLSLIPIGMTFLIYIIMYKDVRKFLFFSGLISVALLVSLNWRELITFVPLFSESKGLMHFVSSGGQHEMSGQFLSVKQFFVYTWPYSVFGIIGFFKYAKKYPICSIFLVVNIFFVAIQIIFYRRFLVYIDAMMIMFASLIFVDMLIWLSGQTWKKFGYIFIMVCMCVGVYVSGHYIYNKKPLISENELLRIRLLEKKVPYDRYIMVLSPYYAPWLYGFSGRDIIAPGMFEHNVWNEYTWQKFWQTHDVKERYDMLSQYNDSPLYIYLGDGFRSFGRRFSDDPHMTHVDINLWRFDK